MKTTRKLKTPKAQKPKPSHIWVVAEHPFEVVGSTGKRTFIHEHTYFEVKSIAADPKGGLILEPTNTETPGYRFRVPAHKVRVFVEPLPDYRLDMHFVEYGYQADHFKHHPEEGLLQHVSSTCRDFGGNYPIPELVERIQKFAERMILSFKKKL